MHLEPHPDFSLISGHNRPTRLVLSGKEIAVLRRAQEICKRAAKLLNEEEDGSFNEAEWKLDVVVTAVSK